MTVLDRSKAPEFKIPESIALTKPIKRTLKNGVPLYFIPTPEIDAVKLEIITESNKQLLEEGDGLVPFFTLNMLMEGTKTMNSPELDNFFDFYASEVDTISTFEQQGVSLLTTKKHFQHVLPVFRSLLTEAVFPEKELEKRKSQKSLTISMQQEQNGARANQLYRKALFGTKHPFGFISEERHVQAVNREKLAHYYKEKFLITPELFVIGNLNEFEIDQIMSTFEDLIIHESQKTPEQFIIWPEKRVSEIKDKAVQSSIRLGQHLIPKQHPDYHALTVFNTILGGYFGSRLIKNIREDKGFTYGIYSSIGSLEKSDYWVVMADVQKGFADEVIKEVYAEIEKLKYTPVSKEEIEIVRNFMAGHFLSSFSNAFDLINRFKTIHYAGLDYSFYEDQLRFFKSFTPEQVMEVGQKYFDTDHIKEVVVG
ncbi:insulinase family protein [Echinicola strongylocentroti]|uniref:Insulinase family protein n=1 Tax=Echinicola strongylocentroti TaxID=1795355 RepID=A0A2Z4INK4_9BACT|nr:pitrilysin family protein [Echinicola strongylocentroti]AWW32320.1 insulinase family protein [Echinicola strongylocentroti]